MTNGNATTTGSTGAVAKTGAPLFPESPGVESDVVAASSTGDTELRIGAVLGLDDSSLMTAVTCANSGTAESVGLFGFEGTAKG